MKSIQEICYNRTRYTNENGELHREDGAALIYNNGNKEWYLNDKYIPVSSQEEFERYIKLKAFI